MPLALPSPAGSRLAPFPNCIDPRHGFGYPGDSQHFSRLVWAAGGDGGGGGPCTMVVTSGAPIGAACGAIQSSIGDGPRSWRSAGPPKT